MSTDQATPLTNTIDVEKRVEQYIKLRDLKADIKSRHEDELKPVVETMVMIEDELKSALQQVNATNMKTDAGTVSLTTKASASAADINAFWTWIITQGAFDMLDKKPNVTAITEYVKQNGVAPPGVNYSTYQGIGVRRK
jgi:hypothetical protein